MKSDSYVLMISCTGAVLDDRSEICNVRLIMKHSVYRAFFSPRRGLNSEDSKKKEKKIFGSTEALAARYWGHWVVHDLLQI